MKIFTTLILLPFLMNSAISQFANQSVISNSAMNATDVYSTDIDGDGDLDVLSSSSEDNKVAWYENDGFGNFGIQHIIDIYPSFESHYTISVSSADLDGDGDMDVFSAELIGDRIVWYANDGSGGFSEAIVISSVADGAKDVNSADLDGDGDLDVLSASTYDGKIAWYENDGNGNFGAQMIINANSLNATIVNSADLDGDGDIDVLSGADYNDEISWYENDGSGNFGEPSIISTETSDPTELNTADIDGDGDLDVISSSSNDSKIAWYENDGSGSFGEANIVSTTATHAQSVSSADFDQDGDLDLVAAAYAYDKIYWYENLGNGDFGEQMIVSPIGAPPFSQYPDGPKSVHCADIDGDGYPDVLSASKNDNEIAWYRFDPNYIDVEEIEGFQEKLFKVFPNPIHDIAYLSYPTEIDGRGEVKITNSLGQVVYTTVPNANGILELDLSEFSSGLYVVSITLDGKNIEDISIIKE